MRLVAGIDIETTGLERGDHRIIEVYIGLYDIRSRKLRKELNQRIDPQRSISAEAQRIHHISIQDLLGKPTWEKVGPVVHKWLSLPQIAGYVWHNGDEFDGPFIDHELKRIGLSLPARPTLDTMEHGRWACPDGKKPTLGELCFACGVPYDTSAGKAHAADYDVGVMMECYFRATEWGFFRPSWADEDASTFQPIAA